MSIVACPRCRDEVTLPPKISPQARVRCPLCRDEYILSEALAAMPPALIVLDPGPDGEGSGYAEPEYRIAGESSGAMAGGMSAGGVFDTTGPMGESAVSTAPRPGLKGKVRKKKEASAFGMIVQVVLGGVGAIVLFQALAWWVMKKDPFELGPTAAKFVPQIVPSQFHGKLKANGTGENTDLAKGNNNVTKFPTPKPNNKASGTGNAFDPGEQFNLDPNTVKPMIDPLDPGSVPPVIPPEPTETKIEDPLNPTPKPAVDPLAPENPAAVKPMPEKPVDFTPPMPKPVDPNAKPAVSSFEFTAASAEAVVKREAFDQADAASKRQAGKEMFESAAALGKLAAAADLTDPELADKASELKEFSILMSGKLPFVNFFALERLKATEGDDGIVIGGKIIDVRTAGDATESTLEITQKSGPVPVTVVSPKDTDGSGPKIGDTAIVLGRVVRDPKKDLPKYTGEAPIVIQSGHTTVVPPM